MLKRKIAAVGLALAAIAGVGVATAGPAAAVGEYTRTSYCVNDSNTRRVVVTATWVDDGYSFHDLVKIRAVQQILTGGRAPVWQNSDWATSLTMAHRIQTVTKEYITLNPPTDTTGYFNRTFYSTAVTAESYVAASGGGSSCVVTRNAV